VISCFSSRRITPPTSNPHASMFTPLVPGKGHTRWLERGVGESQFRRGDIHCGTLCIYVLCALIALPPGGRSQYYLSTWEAWATGAMPWGNGTWAATPRRSRPPTGISAQIPFHLVYTVKKGKPFSLPRPGCH
jgi:hypothetical protein